MKVKRVVKFNIKKSHIDYQYIKVQLIESKEIYNFANYILRQIYFKNTHQSMLPHKQYTSKLINQLMYKREEQLRNYIGYYTNQLIEILKKKRYQN